MGIYGSVAFMIGRRRREIGIRKVMGATEPGILWMLTKEFSGPVVTAAAVAWPLGIYFSRGWLNGFAYRAAIGWTTVPLAVFIVMSVAGLAVVSQALPASRENPAVTIRHE
jgi:ABC-type antimicrobial peptide transport system permease subunit